MDWNQEALMAMRVLLAVLLGGFVGWERERHGREAGIRTYAAVSLGSTHARVTLIVTVASVNAIGFSTTFRFRDAISAVRTITVSAAAKPSSFTRR